MYVIMINNVIKRGVLPLFLFYNIQCSGYNNYKDLLL